MEDLAARRDNRPWIIEGDFNAVMETQERKGAKGLSEPDNQLINFVNKKGLMNPSLEGGKFTWSNFREEPALSRIDRFLISPEWLEVFAGIKQKKLERTISDHFPICVELSAVKWGPSPFRFENAWLKTEGFKNMIAQWWGESHEEGHASFRITKKIQYLKQKLKIWRKEKYEAKLGEKEPLLLEMSKLDEEEEKEGSLPQEKAIRRVNIKAKVSELLQWEEIAWRQRSRELWLKEGDRNTGYFHKMVTIHRNNNHIKHMLIKGQLTENMDEIKEGSIEFYKELYTERSKKRPTVEGLSFNKISEEGAVWLEREFTEKEVWEVIKSCRGDKLQVQTACQWRSSRTTGRQ